MKKKILCGLAAVLVIILAGFAALHFFRGPVIGNLSGAENEWMYVNGQKYEQFDSDELTIGDRGSFMGRVEAAHGEYYRVYSVIGDINHTYLYACSMGRGAFYKLVPLSMAPGDTR